jgi:hypothetical protein
LATIGGWKHWRFCTPRRADTSIRSQFLDSMAGAPIAACSWMQEVDSIASRIIGSHPDPQTALCAPKSSEPQRATEILFFKTPKTLWISVCSVVQANPLTTLDVRDRTQAALRARQLGLA